MAKRKKLEKWETRKARPMTKLHMVLICDATMDGQLRSAHLWPPLSRAASITRTESTPLPRTMGATMAL